MAASLFEEVCTKVREKARCGTSHLDIQFVIMVAPLVILGFGLIWIDIMLQRDHQRKLKEMNDRHSRL